MAETADQALSKWRHPRYLLFLAVLLVAPWPLVTFLTVGETVIAAFDLAALCFILSCVPLWKDGNADLIRRQAVRDDVGQSALLLIAGFISAIVLGTLGLLILHKSDFGASGIALIIVTLMACWTFANLTCAFHYARLYYSRHRGSDRKGLEFPGDVTPDFSDFVNFAFVIGMTCQTADIGISDTAMRRVSTFHGLFAFAFNLGILALAINLLASSST